MSVDLHIDAKLTLFKINCVRVRSVGRFGDWAVRLGHQQARNIGRSKHQGSHRVYSEFGSHGAEEPMGALAEGSREEPWLG